MRGVDPEHLSPPRLLNALLAWLREGIQHNENGATQWEIFIAQITAPPGKALNDPLKGISALSRAGVTFTQSQQDSIKAMVGANDLLGAQKIILGEVEKQVGGTAKATATNGEKASV